MFTELCERIWVIVSVEKKMPGFITARRISKITRIPNVPYFCQIILKVTFSLGLTCFIFSDIVFTFLSYQAISAVDALIMFSSVASLCGKVLTISPSLKTWIVSHTARSSVSSDETTSTPLPSSASFRIRA